ncbi:nucleotide pyrophosphohydrolase [Candidatus Dependentiae bacterium]|nr:nucleotide pyrophosphohydrolase [Candidatus Dependentiae bacterium]
MTDATTTLEDLKKKMLSFADEREWGQFHTPKNLTMALAVEAAELMELFMWLDAQESIHAMETNREAIEQEVADVAAYLVALCGRYKIDLATAFERKMELNSQKYPVEKSKGRSTKYTQL